jgi:hypothetical protein
MFGCLASKLKEEASKRSMKGEVFCDYGYDDPLSNGSFLWLISGYEKSTFQPPGPNLLGKGSTHCLVSTCHYHGRDSIYIIVSL